MNTSKVIMGAAALVLGTVTFSVQAAVTKGTPCMEMDASVVSDGSSMFSDDCVGILEGKNGGEINYKASDLNTDKAGSVHTSNDSLAWSPGAFARTDWVDRAKYEDGSGSALGFDLSLDGAIISWTTTTELNGTWVVLVKQAKQVVLYLFEDLEKTTSGEINLSKLHGQGYSHITLLSQEGGGGGPGEPVSVPSTLLLMGLGLIYLATVRRRPTAYQPFSHV